MIDIRVIAAMAAFVVLICVGAWTYGEMTCVALWRQIEKASYRVPYSFESQVRKADLNDKNLSTCIYIGEIDGVDGGSKFRFCDLPIQSLKTGGWKNDHGILSWNCLQTSRYPRVNPINTAVFISPSPLSDWNGVHAGPHCNVGGRLLAKIFITNCSGHRLSGNNLARDCSIDRTNPSSAIFYGSSLGVVMLNFGGMPCILQRYKKIMSPPKAATKVRNTKPIVILSRLARARSSFSFSSVLLFILSATSVIATTIGRCQSPSFCMAGGLLRLLNQFILHRSLRSSFYKLASCTSSNSKTASTTGKTEGVLPHKPREVMASEMKGRTIRVFRKIAEIDGGDCRRLHRASQ